LGNSFDQVFRGNSSSAAGGGATDVSDVFSNYLYIGDGSAQVLVNGIDLDGEGGMVWYRSRAASNNSLEDTVRGVDKVIRTDTTGAEADPDIYGVQAFNSNGFTAGVTVSGTKNVSWTFRKAPKFFDIVTYTGNGASGRLIDHNLGSAPGMVTVKSTSTSGTYWSTYHRGTAANSYVLLNGTQRAESNAFTRTVSSTQYELGPNWADENQSGRTYVAYFFAHNNNDGEFGPDADQDIIKCGSYTGNGDADGPVINLGFEPQWLMYKNVTGAGDNWEIVDTMRGMPTDGNTMRILKANTSDAEAADNAVGPTATGFKVRNAGGSNNDDGSTYIYMAIRAPMMTPPAAATEVFSMQASYDGSLPRYKSSHVVDMAWIKATGAEDAYISSRLTQGKYLKTREADGEATSTNFSFDYSNGWYEAVSDRQTWMWKRAKGYFDVVCYTGTGSAKTEAHSLGVTPEMMWVKSRNTTRSWSVFHSALGPTKGGLGLNLTSAASDDSTVWNDTSPTSTVFTVGTYGNVNTSDTTYIAYLFATLAGISKVGSVAHSGSSTDVDCGFSNGARFVLLKRTDSTGSWYYWDTVRGIIAGDDPYLLLDSSSAQVTNTDFIDPLSSGFTITGDFTDGTYIFYAIA
tara:strand:+ start:428 stop:2317 length:1890 start_codon:yes stop_codon:yes gene_type:complete